jgi:hypothetical protein
VCAGAQPHGERSLLLPDGLLDELDVPLDGLNRCAREVRLFAPQARCGLGEPGGAREKAVWGLGWLRVLAW